MGNIVKLKNIVKDILNTNCLDPYPSSLTRKGLHFFSETDGLNFSRGDTFPKGEIRAELNSPELSGIGSSGYSRNSAIIDIYYYSKENMKYSDGDITYKNEDLIHYMIKQIKDTILANRFKGYYLNRNSIGQATEPMPITAGNFKLYYSVLPITFYWCEEYGN